MAKAYKAAINDFGQAAFEIEVVSKAKSIGELMDLEVSLIEQDNSLYPNGYNLTRGGGGTRTNGVSITVSGQRFPSLAAAQRHLVVHP